VAKEAREQLATMKPNELSIVGLTYEVKWATMEEVGDDKLGWCDFTGLVITICEDQPTSALANTFLHEVIHAINYSMGIKSMDEENLTNRLASGLCAVWRENPVAFKWWTALILEGKATKKPTNGRKKRRIAKRKNGTRKPSRRR